MACPFPFAAESDWWSGKAETTTYSLYELFGSNLRAFYHRRKGRDLFDIWFALTSGGASAERVVSCLVRYLSEKGRRMTRVAFLENLVGKLAEPLFQSDMIGLLRSGIA